MDIYCRVTATGLVPMYDSDYDEKKRLKEGDTVLCHITHPRNYENHKRFFALLRLTEQNLPHLIQQQLQIFSEKDMLECLKMDLGLFTTVWHGGRQFVRTGSISFAEMDEDEFKQFFLCSLNIILSKYLRGSERETIVAEIENFK